MIPIFSRSPLFIAFVFMILEPLGPLLLPPLLLGCNFSLQLSFQQVVRRVWTTRYTGVSGVPVISLSPGSQFRKFLCCC